MIPIYDLGRQWLHGLIRLQEIQIDINFKHDVFVRVGMLGETATKHIEFNSVGNAGRDSSFLKQETNLRGVDLIGGTFQRNCVLYHIIQNHGYFQHITTQIMCRNNRCRLLLLVYLPVQRRNRLKHTNYVLESLLLLYLAQIRDSFQIGSVSEDISCSLLNID